MGISFHDSGQIRKIDVLGSTVSVEDRQTLLENIRQAPGPKCDISFYDARILPPELIEALANELAAGRELKFFVYHNYLSHFLHRIGMPVRYIPSMSGPSGDHEFQTLVLGGSAESLDKICQIVENLPPSNTAVFIVQHILEDGPNRLDRLLKAPTGYQVLIPQHLMTIKPGTIYIAPPGHHMKIGQGLVYLTRDAKRCFARPSVGVLYESAAHEFGDKVLAVQLCGYGRDGVDALETLRAKGACVLVETPEECGDARSMPETARESGNYDYVLSIREICCFVHCALAKRSRKPDKIQLELFLKAVFAHYGYDFSGYRPGTIERRIDVLTGLMEIESFFVFQRDVFSDPAMFDRFFTEISINVTGFFRHPRQFSYLREKVLPYLSSFPRIKIWSAGCSTGEEVYSLAILLDEMGMLEKTQLFATDINNYVIEQARSGLYPLEALKMSGSNYLESGGIRSFDDYVSNNGRYLKIHERFSKHILFHHHSLVHDGVFNEFQLILCRNVLIYFQDKLQERVLERFARSLHKDGFLMLGPSEEVGVGKGGSFFRVDNREMHVFRWN